MDPSKILNPFLISPYVLISTLSHICWSGKPCNICRRATIARLMTVKASVLTLPRVLPLLGTTVLPAAKFLSHYVALPLLMWCQRIRPRLRFCNVMVFTINNFCLPICISSAAFLVGCPRLVRRHFCNSPQLKALSICRLRTRNAAVMRAIRYTTWRFIEAYDFTCCSVWIWILVSDPNRRM